MKYFISFFIIFSIISCNQEIGKIKFTSYLILENGTHQIELPPSGIQITIDTIIKKITIPLAEATNNQHLFHTDTDYFPYYNPQTKSVDYSIKEIQYKPEGILFITEANGESFRCGYLDNSLSVILSTKTIVYAGGEEAKKQAQILNQAKQKLSTYSVENNIIIHIFLSYIVRNIVVRNIVVRNFVVRNNVCTIFICFIS